MDMSLERGFFYEPPTDHGSGTNGEQKNHEPVEIRPFRDSDAPQLVALMRRNFSGAAFSLYPKDVIAAYKAANSEADIRHAAHSGGTEAYVAWTADEEIGGFVLIRYNPNTLPRRNAYGELDLRRLHVDPGIQGKGVGQELSAIVMKRAKALNIEYVTTHASGSARPYFEKNVWEGITHLNHMKKRRTSALVFAAQRRVGPVSLRLYPTTTHIIYAGSNMAKAEHLQNVVGRPVQRVEAEEIPTNDVVDAARSKARNGSENLVIQSGTVPLIVSNDIRTDILVVNPPGDETKYGMLNRGKPQTANHAQINFKLLLDTARITKKPAPYVVRAATYLHNPLDPNADTYGEQDVSVWLTQEGLQILASDSGFKQYREEVRATFGVDINEMAAGFALPVFFSRGYVAGLYGHPFNDTFRNRDEAVQRATKLVIGGMDEKLIKQRLGMLV